MIIDGCALAKKVEKELKDSLLYMNQKKIAFILFLDTPATRQFVGLKTKVAERLGIKALTIECFDCITTKEAVAKVIEISKQDYDGVVVQLPLPEGFDTQKILDMVPDSLDTDALASGSQRIAPVARAVHEIFNYYTIDLAYKKIVILGNGKLVGQPVARMLVQQGFLFDIIEKETPKEQRNTLLKNADIIISGVGIPGIITSDMIKEGVILIDAGTSEQAGKLVGDIDPACADKAFLMTPVPGGVGPLTVTSLFKNLIHRL